MALKNPPPGWSTKKAKKYSPDLSPAKGKTNLRIDDFDDFVKQHGVPVKIFRTLLCPNVKSVDGAEHEIDCEVCKGSGFLDTKPLCTLAFIQSVENSTEHFSEGYYDGNTILVTFPQGIELQYFTLMKITDESDIFTERVVRSGGNIDVLKYVAFVIHVLIDKNGQEYYQGNDFNVCEGNIDWIPGKGPDRGTIYSIHYETETQFRAIKAMHVNRFAHIRDKDSIRIEKINEQWMMQKEFLVDRKDRNGNKLAPNKIRQPDDDSSDEDPNG